MLPKLFERTGMGEKGSITALYTVLVEGDDLDEPISDAVRSVLDGHLVLSRELANRNHYPAIDILGSVSRCQSDVIDNDHKKILGGLLKSMAVYSESEDMIQLGAYAKGTNKNLDLAIMQHPLIESFLVQAIEESSSKEETFKQFSKLVMEVQEESQEESREGPPGE
jgi:flagellum-specific ATP synthase